MTATPGALAYLIGRSTRNRLRSQIKRVRNPRYAIAFIVGLLYFGLVIFGRSIRTGTPRPSVISGPGGMVLAPLFIIVTVFSSWLLSADASALAFTQAEVSMLFTAPVSRRGLIVYKLVRAQIAILLSAMLMTFFLGRGSAEIPHFLAGLGYWSMLSTINLHGLGAALVRSRSQERSGASPGRRRVARMLGLVFSMAIMFAFIGPGMSGRGSGDGGPFAFLNGVVAFMSTPTVHLLLTPFRAVVAPAFAHTTAEWAGAFAIALAILGAHLWWILTADAAFEEAAAAASERRAKMIEAMRSRRGGAAMEAQKTAVRTIALSGRGNPALAIVWKNTLALGRNVQLNQLMMPLVMSIVVSAGAGRGAKDAAQTVAIGLLFFTLMLAITGSLVVRNDLRSDMLHLPFLKSIPLSGRQIVFAEVMSGALPLAALQLVLLAGVTVALAMSTHDLPVPFAVRMGLMAASPFALLAFNGAAFALLNGTAVLFPAWIRLGPSGGGGIELMGQAMLTMLGIAISMLVLLLLPGAAIGGAFAFVDPHTVLGVAAIVIVGSVILAAEAYGIIALLGRSFERAEPQQLT